MRPGLLLLDEPTANLDPDGVLEVRDAVESALETTGATLVVVEHRVTVWRDLVDRVIVLAADGGVLADGHPDAVLADNADVLRRAGVWLPRRARAGGAVGDGWSAAPVGPRARHRAWTVRAPPPSCQRSAVEPLSPRVDLGIAEGIGRRAHRPERGRQVDARTHARRSAAPARRNARSEPGLAAGAGAEPWAWRSRDLLTRIGSVFQNPEHQFVAATVRAELAVGPRALRTSDAEIDATRRRAARAPPSRRASPTRTRSPFLAVRSAGSRSRPRSSPVRAMLVLDEPTFGQDALTWAELVD